MNDVLRFFLLSLVQVKDVLVELNSLYTCIRDDYSQQERALLNHTLITRIFHCESETCSTNSNLKFIHEQLFIDCLIRMGSSISNKNALINFCRVYYESNPDVLQMINRFQQEYTSENALDWFTRPSFIFRLLNKALCVQNIDLLVLLQFFMHDIGCALGKNHSSNSIRVYRYHWMSKSDIEQLKQSGEKLISMNSFLLASTNRNQSRDLLDVTIVDTDMEKVCLDIETNPTFTNVKAYAPITFKGDSSSNQAILFMIGSIFRRVQISYDHDQICNIRLVQCSFDDAKLAPILTSMKTYLRTSKTDFSQLGDILYELKMYTHAEKYYRRYINQLSDERSDLIISYAKLAKTAQSTNNYQSSVNFYNRCLEMLRRNGSLDYTHIANIHNDVAHVYCQLNQNEQAILAYKKAVDIWEHADRCHHRSIVQCLNNIGSIHRNDKKYHDAIEIYETALKILLEHLKSCDYRDRTTSQEDIDYIDKCQHSIAQDLLQCKQAASI
jgi:tetratricopeptide (TPR) repeat protein